MGRWERSFSLSFSVCVCVCACMRVCVCVRERERERNPVLCLHIILGILCTHFCCSCKAQCAPPCLWDTVLYKWPLLLSSSPVTVSWTLRVSPPSHHRRLKVQPQLTELLRNLPISKDWAATGRLCSPRVLFVFQTQTLGPNAEDDGSSKSRSQVWLWLQISIAGMAVTANLDRRYGCDCKSQSQVWLWLQISIAGMAVTAFACACTRRIVANHCFRCGCHWMVITSVFATEEEDCSKSVLQV